MNDPGSALQTGLGFKSTPRRHAPEHLALSQARSSTSWTAFISICGVSRTSIGTWARLHFEAELPPPRPLRIGEVAQVTFERASVHREGASQPGHQLVDGCALLSTVVERRQQVYDRQPTGQLSFGGILGHGCRHILSLIYRTISVPVELDKSTETG